MTCSFDHIVWTGPIDEYYGHCFGALPYRSLRFEAASVATPGGGLVQPVAVINQPSEDVPYTRVTEYRHLTGQVADVSTLHHEYPSAVGDPYHPVPRPDVVALAAVDRERAPAGRATGAAVRRRRTRATRGRLVLIASSARETGPSQREESAWPYQPSWSVRCRGP